MANLRKENPVGLDVVIDTIQDRLYELKNDWGVNLDGYPRCEILLKGKEKTIEAYLGNDEYTGSLIFAEENKFFFVAGEKEIQVERPFWFETQIEVYFMLDLSEIYSNIQHKADAEVRFDVVKKLSTLTCVKKIDVESNGDKVFNRFNNRISQNYEYEYTDGMGKYHYFKCIIELMPYNLTNKMCNNN